MSGWGCVDGGNAEATPDGWGAAPTTTRPAVVSNLRESSVGALFSPDEPSPNEWSGAGAGGRWGDGDGDEGCGDGDDAGGWGGNETFGDGAEAHDWGRSDVVDDDGMSVGAADDDGGGGSANDEDPPRDAPVTTDSVARANERAAKSNANADGSGRRIASNGDSSRVADLADKENVEVLKRRRMSLLGPSPAPAPAPPRRMHGWKSNWAVEGMAQAKANSLSAPAQPAATRERSPAASASPPASPLDSEADRPADAAGERDSGSAEADPLSAEAAPERTRTRRRESAISDDWGSECDSEDELLAGSGLTQTRRAPPSPDAERRRAARLRAAVAARATRLKRSFELGAPPGAAPASRPAAPRASRPAASDSSDDAFCIAVSTRGRGRKKAPARTSSPRGPAERRARTGTPAATPGTAALDVVRTSRAAVDLVDSGDEETSRSASDAEAEADDGRATEREDVSSDAAPRTAATKLSPERRGLGGPMSRLPRAPAPAPPAAWRARLPHFTPASELTKGEYRDGEKVFIDYARQFEGGQSGAGGPSNGGAERGGGRWFREAGANKFVDEDGEVLEGRAAWRASERRKKSAAAAARARR